MTGGGGRSVPWMADGSPISPCPLSWIVVACSVGVPAQRQPCRFTCVQSKTRPATHTTTNARAHKGSRPATIRDVGISVVRALHPAAKAVQYPLRVFVVDNPGCPITLLSPPKVDEYLYLVVHRGMLPCVPSLHLSIVVPCTPRVMTVSSSSTLSVP